MADAARRAGELRLRSRAARPRDPAGRVVRRSSTSRRASLAAGVQLTVVLAAVRDQMIERDGVRYEFVDDGRAVPRRSPVRGSRVRRSADVSTTSSRSTPTSCICTASSALSLARRLRAALHDVPLLVQDHGSACPAARGDSSGASPSAKPTPSRSPRASRPRPSSRRECFAAARRCSSCSRTRRSSGSAIATRRGPRRALFGDPCVLWTGRLDGNKDPLVVLDAFERAARRAARRAALVSLRRRAPPRRRRATHRRVVHPARPGDAARSVHARRDGGALPRGRPVRAAQPSRGLQLLGHRGAGLRCRAPRQRHPLACGGIVGDAGALVPSATRTRSPARSSSGRGAIRRRVAPRHARGSSARSRTTTSAAICARAYETMMAVMKLAIVTPGGVDESGTERVIPAFLWLIERLARRHDVHVFALSQEPRPRDWTLLGATGAQRRHRRRAAAALPSPVRARASRGPFDLVHALFGGSALHAISVATLFRLPAAHAPHRRRARQSAGDRLRRAAQPGAGGSYASHHGALDAHHRRYAAHAPAGHRFASTPSSCHSVSRSTTGRRCAPRSRDRRVPLGCCTSPTSGR